MPSWRLTVTLGLAGTVAGMLLVTVFQATQPAIQAHKAKMLRLAIQEVLHEPARFETLYVLDGALAWSPPDGVKQENVDRVYLGYGEDDEPVGFALVNGAPGFQDIIRVILGYDPVASRLLGMKVLESKETPGLGDKIEKDRDFVSQFDGAVPPLVVAKRSGGGDESRSQIDAISGATISSRAVVRIVNDALSSFQPVLERGVPPAASDPVLSHADEPGP